MLKDIKWKEQGTEIRELVIKKKDISMYAIWEKYLSTNSNVLLRVEASSYNEKEDIRNIELFWLRNIELFWRIYKRSWERERVVTQE